MGRAGEETWMDHESGDTVVVIDVGEWASALEESLSALLFDRPSPITLYASKRGESFMRKRPITAGESTAYHEAGHAVVAYRLAFVVYRVTIVPGGDERGRYAGQCEIEHDPVNRHRWETDINARRCVENVVTYLWAGAAAEERLAATRGYFFDISQESAFDSWGGDVADIAAPLRDVFGDYDDVMNEDALTTEGEAYSYWLRERARRIVVEEWNGIVAVAKRLRRKRDHTITGDELKAIVG